MGTEALGQTQDLLGVGVRGDMGSFRVPPALSSPHGHFLSPSLPRQRPLSPAPRVPGEASPAPPRPHPLAFHSVWAAGPLCCAGPSRGGGGRWGSPV